MQPNNTYIGGAGYGLVSAWGQHTPKQNIFLHHKLKHELESLGYEPTESSCDSGSIPSLCWFVPDIILTDLVELARRYEQKAVIFSPQNGHGCRTLEVNGLPHEHVSISEV